MHKGIYRWSPPVFIMATSWNDQAHLLLAALLGTKVDKKLAWKGDQTFSPWWCPQCGLHPNTAKAL